MSYENIKYGMRVTAGGKTGIVREIGDKFKVKFDDGSFGFFSGNEVTVEVEDTRLKSNRTYDRMKAENKLRNDTVFMEPTAAGEDPLAQPKRTTGRGVGENQNVLGKEISEDKFTI